MQSWINRDNNGTYLEKIAAIGEVTRQPEVWSTFTTSFSLNAFHRRRKNRRTLCTISFQIQAASGSNTCSNRSFWKQSGLTRACPVYAYVPRTRGNVREVTPSGYSPRYPMLFFRNTCSHTTRQRKSVEYDLGIAVVSLRTKCVVDVLQIQTVRSGYS